MKLEPTEAPCWSAAVPALVKLCEATGHPAMFSESEDAEMDPADIERWFKSVIECARQALAADGEITPVLQLCVVLGGRVTMVSLAAAVFFESFDAKLKMRELVRGVAQEARIIAVSLAAEAWVLPEEKRAQAAREQGTLRPDFGKVEGRREGLIVSLETPELAQVATCEITRDKAGRPSAAEPRIDVTPLGFLGNMLRNHGPMVSA